MPPFYGFHNNNDFLLDFYSNCVTILYRFQEIKGYKLTQETVLLQRYRATHLSLEILKLRNIPFEKDCNRQIIVK